jgi:hypothetical protein
MIFRIPAGKHRARPFRFGLWFRRTHFSWVVKFDESCRYDLGTDDQFDTNKLVGIGYLWHHHKDSARFGWRYWTERKEIEISAYCYVNGRRVIQHIGFCKIGKEYKIHLTVSKQTYFFGIDDCDSKAIWYTEVPKYHQKRLQYRLGTYFGGQSVAPYDIKIQIERA